MVVDKKSIEEKLVKLEGVIKALEKYSRISREDFLADYTVNSATMHNLVLGIEIIVDVGNHLLHEVYRVHPQEYRRVIEMLGEYEIVPERFAEENADMARFRNLIVHQYIDIDMKQVYENLQKAPEIFRKFAKYYLEFLEKGVG